MFNMGTNSTSKLHTTVGTVFKYLGKAIEARELFYAGQLQASQQAYTEKHPNMGPEDAKYRYATSQQGKQLIADNRWHMAQSRTFGIAAIASAVLQLVYEQQQTNRLLKEQVRLLQNLDSNLDNIHSNVKEMKVY